jgi:hypothetical protein
MHNITKFSRAKGQPTWKA